MSEPCIFCRIVEGQIPVNFLYQGEKVLAFPDINPQSPTHILIIPKQHHHSLEDVPPEEMDFVTEMFSAVRFLSAQQGIAEQGYRLVMNVRPEGGQSVYHIHMHLLGGRAMGPNLTGVF